MSTPPCWVALWKGRSEYIHFFQLIAPVCSSFFGRQYVLWLRLGVVLCICLSRSLFHLIFISTTSYRWYNGQKVQVVSEGGPVLHVKDGDMSSFIRAIAVFFPYANPWSLVRILTIRATVFSITTILLHKTAMIWKWSLSVMVYYMHM